MRLFKALIDVPDLSIMAGDTITSHPADGVRIIRKLHGTTEANLHGLGLREVPFPPGGAALIPEQFRPQPAK